MGVDVLAFGAHPDDVELTIGGTLLAARDAGSSTAVVDLTAGEMGTRGSREIRAQESAAATRLLGLAERRCLDLPDAFLQTDREALLKVAEVLRELRPRVVLTPYWNCVHPDHEACSRIVQRACYLAGLGKYPAPGQPHRPAVLLHFMMHLPFRPMLVVDTSTWFERKLEAARCYASQFLREGVELDDRPFTARRDVLSILEARDRTYGAMINAQFGEPLTSRRPVPVRDIVGLLGK